MTQVRPYLEMAGRFTVEQIPCPHFSQPVDLDAPRTGVVHTTEGHWDDGLAVFKTHFAPHFLVGAGRIAQLVQVGTIGAALVTHNDHAIVQIEVVSFSKQTLWLPDDTTTEALAALMATCQREYGIPLSHPWVDGDYGLYGDNPHRHAGKWGVVAGWFGHGDVPSPDDHWDPGALEWSRVFAHAAGMTDVTTAPAWTPPQPPVRPCACGPVVGSTAWVQTALNKLGQAPPLDVDGLTGSGSKTAAAIASFQQKNGLFIDGIAGPLTISALQKATGS